MRVQWMVPAACALLAGSGLAHAGDFDARGAWHLGEDVVLAEGFETAGALVARNAQLLTARYEFINTDEATLWGHITLADGKSLEGNGRLVIERDRGGPAYLYLDIPEVDGRVEVRLWVQAEPEATSMSALYDAGNGQSYTFATVTANATGRRTSDGWIELSTGPIDSQVLGVPLKRILIGTGFGTVVADAFEVIRVGDRVVPDGAACSVATVQEDCGTYGECIFGACVESAAVWGPVPGSARHRKEYVDRLSHVFRRLHANRKAVSERGEAFHNALMALAETDSPRIFWSGITRAVHDFRDQHTGAPMNYGAFYGSVPSSLHGSTSGVIGACFGLTELDLRGGGRGYTVFRTDGTGGLTGTALQVGDILTSIDGEPVDTWLARAGAFGVSAPSDPRSDPSWLAVQLPSVMSTRAREFTVLRCESTTTCDAPETIPVQVADPVRQAVLTGGHIYNVLESQSCDGRFTNAVSQLASPRDDGYDTVSYERQGELAVYQFDGFSGDEQWEASFQQGFDANPTGLLFDARLGNGGIISSAQFLIDALRDDDSPVRAFGVARPWHALDPVDYYDGLMVCMEATPSFLYDACSGTITFRTSGQGAPADTQKVAWLNTADVSANDFVPRALKGRPNLRIFSPTVTSGAYGAVVGLPSLVAGEYSGGSIQIHDTRFATDTNGLKAAPYESGTGVEPDEVVIQNLSDSLVGQDTMLTRALAWLQEMP